MQRPTSESPHFLLIRLVTDIFDELGIDDDDVDGVEVVKKYFENRHRLNPQDYQIAEWWFEHKYGFKEGVRIVDASWVIESLTVRAFTKPIILDGEAWFAGFPDRQRGKSVGQPGNALKLLFEHYLPMIQAAVDGEECEPAEEAISVADGDENATERSRKRQREDGDMGGDSGDMGGG
ncbi:hypothetical protein HK102_010822, partial [Quaeritorhiza haematococci]